MFNFRYEIKINDQGRPYVHIDTNQVNHPEHKFMALEISRYLLMQLLKDNEETGELNEDTEIAIANAGYVLDNISDMFAKLIKEQNNALDDLGLDIKDDE